MCDVNYKLQDAGRTWLSSFVLKIDIEAGSNAATRSSARARMAATSSADAKPGTARKPERSSRGEERVRPGARCRHVRARFEVRLNGARARLAARAVPLRCEHPPRAWPRGIGEGGVPRRGRRPPLTVLPEALHLLLRQRAWRRRRDGAARRVAARARALHRRCRAPRPPAAASDAPARELVAAHSNAAALNGLEASGN